METNFTESPRFKLALAAFKKARKGTNLIESPRLELALVKLANIANKSFHQIREDQLPPLNQIDWACQGKVNIFVRRIDLLTRAVLTGMRYEIIKSMNEKDIEILAGMVRALGKVKVELDMMRLENLANEVVLDSYLIPTQKN